MDKSDLNYLLALQQKLFKIRKFQLKGDLESSKVSKVRAFEKTNLGSCSWWEASAQIN